MENKIITTGDYFKETFIECANEILKSTCQLFYKTKPIGSGILIQVNDSYFLVSAAHVLEPKYITEMMIPTGQEHIGIDGFMEVTAVPVNESRSDDKIDVAIIKLKEEVAEAVKKCFSFLSLDRIQINHSVTEKPQYMVCGYPLEWTEVNEEKEECKTKPLIVRTKATEKALNNAVFTKYSKINVDYKRWEQHIMATNEKASAPHPKGVSGSGLWFIPTTLVPAGIAPPFKLIGIMTDYLVGGDQVLVSTRIDIVTEVMRQKFGINIPMSTIIKVNIKEDEK